MSSHFGYDPAFGDEIIEEASVTDARKGLLPSLEKLQKNANMRVLIRKHGKPAAVLMSVPAFERLRAVIDKLIAENEAKTEEEELAEAVAEMLQERLPRTLAKDLENAVSPSKKPFAVAAGKKMAMSRAKV